MLRQESLHPDEVVFYHGTNNAVDFLSDVVTEFRKLLEFQSEADHRIITSF